MYMTPVNVTAAVAYTTYYHHIIDIDKYDCACGTCPFGSLSVNRILLTP